MFDLFFTFLNFAADNVNENTSQYVNLIFSRLFHTTSHFGDYQSLHILHYTLFAVILGE